MTNTGYISAENLSKKYRLGVIGSSTIREDFHRWWDGLRGRKLDIPGGPSSAAGDGREEIWALRDVSFEVQQGQVLGIIGRNGAGKSTLLKILSRVTAPTSGVVRIKGHIASLLEVGTGFHPELTGRDNIFLNGAILGMRRAEIQQKFDEIVAFSEIEKFIDTPVKRYSSGMYVRLAFAVAAHLDPDILVVDEVLAVGDISFQKRCMDKMKDVSTHGRTVLFVSHNLAAVRKLCPTCILLKDGSIVQRGATAEVLDHYTRLMSTSTTSTRVQATPPPDCGADASIRVHEAGTFSASGEHQTQFNMNEPVVVRLRVEILDENVDHHFYFRFLNQDDTLVFAAGDWDDDRLSHHQYAKGEYTISTVVPPHLLNDGAYAVSIDGLIPNVRYVFRWDQSACFSIIPIGGAGGATSLNRRGICRPLLPWTIERT